MDYATVLLPLPGISKELKSFVRSVTTSHMFSGWDEKAFSRSGDLASVAILQTVDGSEMPSSETVRDVLIILRAAFACPHRCVKVIGDQQPRVALLLLEHLHNNTHGKMRSEIEETKKFVLEQSRGVE
jgi:hypothetical protein